MVEILSIYFRENFKDSIVDCLLDDNFDDFYYFPCKKYSTKALSSAKERVTGRIDYGKIEVAVNETNKPRLISKLYRALGREHLRIFSSRMEEN